MALHVWIILVCAPTALQPPGLRVTPILLPFVSRARRVITWMTKLMIVQTTWGIRAHVSRILNANLQAIFVCVPKMERKPLTVQESAVHLARQMFAPVLVVWLRRALPVRRTMPIFVQAVMMCIMPTGKIVNPTLVFATMGKRRRGVRAPLMDPTPVFPAIRVFV